MRLSDNQAQHILDILNEHARQCEKQSHKAATALEKSDCVKEFAETHRTIKAFLNSLKKKDN